MSSSTYSLLTKGFLPEKCLDGPPKQFEFLKNILKNLHNKNILEFREMVNNSNPNQNDIVEYFLSNPIRCEIEFIYSKTSMIIHKYIWGNYKEDVHNVAIKENSIKEVQKLVIPKNIGYPWIKSSELLGIKPALTHAAVDLFN